MKRMCKPEERVKIEAWLENQSTLKPQGRKRFWKRFLTKDTGCRLGANGQGKKTFQSPHAEEEAQVAADVAAPAKSRGAMSKEAVRA